MVLNMAGSEYEINANRGYKLWTLQWPFNLLFPHKHYPECQAAWTTCHLGKGTGGDLGESQIHHAQQHLKIKSR